MDILKKLRSNLKNKEKFKYIFIGLLTIILFLIFVIVNEYKDKNFTIVGISLDKDKSKWMKAIADDNLAWTHLSDLKYWDSEIPALYGVRGIPANVLLDPDGVIVAKNITGEDLHKKLKEVIK